MLSERGAIFDDDSTKSLHEYGMTCLLCAGILQSDWYRKVEGFTDWEITSVSMYLPISK